MRIRIRRRHSEPLCEFVFVFRADPGKPETESGRTHPLGSSLALSSFYYARSSDGGPSGRCGRELLAGRLG